MPAYDGVRRGGAFAQAEARVSYWKKHANQGILSDSGKFVVSSFNNGGSNINGIPSVADQRVFVAAKVAKIGNVAPSGGGLIHGEPGEIVKPDIIVKKKIKVGISRVFDGRRSQSQRAAR